MEDNKVIEEDLNQAVLVQDDKTFNRNKWFFATGGIGRDMMYCLISSYFFTYVQFGLTLTVAQFATLSLLIGILGRIWDGINDPMMGSIIDGAHLKWGKFKPWIFIGAILSGILLLLVFNVRPFKVGKVYGWIYVALICFIYLLWEAAFTMNDIGYWGMIPSLSRSRERRDKLTSMTIFFAGVGSGIMTLLVTILSPGNLLNAYTLYSIIACVMLIGCQTMTTFTVKEAPRNKEEDNENVSLKKTFHVILHNKQVLWISLAYIIYDTGGGLLGALAYNLYYLEVGYDSSLVIVMIAIAGINMVLQLLYPKITKNWTRKKTQKISLIVMIFGYTGLALLGWFKFLPLNILTLSIFYAFTAVGGTYFYISTLINMSNCVEYNEYTTGERNEAVISSVRPLVVKFSSAIKSLIVTLVLIMSGLYALSQNISNLETESNLFNKKVAGTVQDIENMKYYTDKINEYGISLEALNSSSDEYKALIESINTEIENLDNDTLEVVQVKAEYIEVYRDMYILKYDENSKLVESKEIRDITDTSSYFIEGYTYSGSFVFTNENNESINVANDIYSSQKTVKTRIILRISVTVVPAIFLAFSCLIQSKKFIVDEKYFDMMEKEIALRKEEKEKERKTDDQTA